MSIENKNLSKHCDLNILQNCISDLITLYHQDLDNSFIT